MGGINLDEELEDESSNDWVHWNEILGDEDKTSLEIEKAFKKN